MKLSKMIYGVVLTALTAVGVISCSDDKLPDFLHSDNREVTLEYDGLTASGIEGMVVLAANSDWRVSQKDEWIKISQESGTRGRHNLFITADINDTGEDRLGFVEIVMGSKTEQYAITQNKKVYSISMNKNTVSFDVIGNPTEEGSDNVVLTTNHVWTVEVPADAAWLKANPAEGSEGETTVTFIAGINTTGADRSAKVDVKVGDLTRQITVVQGSEAFSSTTPSYTDVMMANGLDAVSSFTIKLNSIDSWTVASTPDWITVSPMSGNAGETDVTLTAAKNEAGFRSGEVLIKTTSGIPLAIKVGQNPGALPFDDKAVGYLYFNDDMAWATGGMDQVGSVNGGSNTTLPIYNAENAVIKAEFDKRYVDFNSKGKSVYAADGYLKFGKSGNQNAFQLKEALDIPSGKQSNVEVSFRFAKNGTDKITLSVAIEGPGKIEGAVNDNGTLSAPCVPVDNTDKTINWQWKDFSVKITGVTSETKIIIGETQYIIDGFATRTGYFRGFIDDISVKRIAND